LVILKRDKIQAMASRIENICILMLLVVFKNKCLIILKREKIQTMANRKENSK
jgi:hypothetical protein